MEAINLNTKENIAKAYDLRPTLFYNVDGILKETKGKDIKVEKLIGGKRAIYSLRLKEEGQWNVGQYVSIDRDTILAMTIETKDDSEDKSDCKGLKEIVKEMGLEDSDETMTAIKCLDKYQIPIDENNLRTFLTSKEHLKEIIESMDLNTCIRLMEDGIDIKRDSLHRINQALIENKGSKDRLSLKDLFAFNKRLDYEDAEAIAKRIYGRSMGKDVYGSILALHEGKITINRENIERVMEVIDKLYDLKTCDDEVFVRFLQEDLPLSIENLYRYKNSYDNKSIGKNMVSPLYELASLVNEESLDHILNILKDLNLDAKDENIGLIREFLQNGIDVTLENYRTLLDMKSKLKELICLLDEKAIVSLIGEGIDLFKQDIGLLLDKIKNGKDIEPDKYQEDTPHLLKQIGELGRITDRELIRLIKVGEDFSIGNLKEIRDTIAQDMEIGPRLVEKARTINNIFNTLGDLNSNIINLASKKFNRISLDNLYKSHLHMETGGDTIIEPIIKVEENLIRREYLNARANITLALISKSVREGIDLEYMALEELNHYIDKDRLGRYQEAQRWIGQISHLRGKEDSLIPLMIKNQMDMSIGHIKNMDSILNGGKGLGNLFHHLSNNRGNYKEDLREKIEILEDTIKKFSQSIKGHRDGIKKDFKRVMEGFNSLNDSANFHDGTREENLYEIQQYLKLQGQIIKGSLILQLPIFTGDEHNNVNLIIPNINKGISKDDMTFHVAMNMKNLGEVGLNIQVRKTQLYVEVISDHGKRFIDKQDVFKGGLERIGYSLEALEVRGDL